MPVDITTEIEIARPIAEVASYAADPTNAPDWYANIVSVEWVTEPPLTAGSKVRFVARFLGTAQRRGCGCATRESRAGSPRSGPR